jgi:hypothetical protein
VLQQVGTQAPNAARPRWRLPLDNKHHVRDTIASGEEKGKAAMHFTDGVRRREEAEAAARWNWCSSACVSVLRVQRGVQELERKFK